MTEDKTPAIYIETTHHDSPRLPDITGISFTIDYTGTQAEVLILEMPVLSDPKQLDGFCEELRRLGSALVEVAQHPQHIFWHHHPRR